MQLQLNIPALLFPAISFLLLPYTNRYLALTSLVRSLLREWRENPQDSLLAQIEVLRHRISLIRLMQTFAVLAMLLSMLSMVSIYQQWHSFEGPFFVGGLIAMVISLIISLIEIQLSTRALDAELNSMDATQRRRGKH